MPQMLRLPNVEELPLGPLRDFVTELHVYFRLSGRPTPAQVATAAGQLNEPVQVSRETVRRLLKGETTSTWPKVKAVHEALCRMAEQDPTWRRFPYGDEDDRTARDYLRDLWNDAVDRVAPDDNSPHPQLDPWATSASNQTEGWGSPSQQPPGDDEPPF